MKNIKLSSACVLLAIGIAEMVRWFIITAKDISFDAMKNEYMAVLPGFLQNVVLHTFLLILCFTGAIVLFLQVKNEKSLAFIAKGGAILSAVLAFWQLFSLM